MENVIKFLLKLRPRASGNVFSIKESRPNDDYATPPKRKKTPGTRSMFSNVCFICMEYRLRAYKQTNYLFQYSSKDVTETADAKIKISVTKNDEKEILFVIANVNLVANEFQKHGNLHARVPSKSDYSTSNTSMEDFTPGLN